MTKKEMVQEMLEGLRLPSFNLSVDIRVRQNTKARIEKVYNWFQTTEKTHQDRMWCLYQL